MFTRERVEGRLMGAHALMGMGRNKRRGVMLEVKLRLWRLKPLEVI